MFDSITNLINEDTEIFYEEYNFLNPILNQYKVNGVLFIPYITHESYEDKFSTYALRLEVYKQNINSSNATINYVTVKGDKNIKFKSITEKLNKVLKFSVDEHNKSLKGSYNELIDEINTYNMQLNDKSGIKVVLNISVKTEDNKIITRDIVYYFKTETTTYLIQR
jgi:hypothetical protein